MVLQKFSGKLAVETELFLRKSYPYDVESGPLCLQSKETYPNTPLEERVL